MERNVDKIKRLEKEMGRCRKKIADQDRVIKAQHESLAIAHGGAAEIQRGVDAIIAQAALTYGEDVRDEESGAFLGKRLTLPAFRVEETLERYEIRARKDETTGEYIVGVVERAHE